MLVSLIRKDHKMFLKPLVSDKHYNGQQLTLSPKMGNCSDLGIDYNGQQLTLSPKMGNCSDLGIENKLILFVNSSYHVTIVVNCVHISQVHISEVKNKYTVSRGHKDKTQ